MQTYFDETVPAACGLSAEEEIFASLSRYAALRNPLYENSNVSPTSPAMESAGVQPTVT